MDGKSLFVSTLYPENHIDRQVQDALSATLDECHLDLKESIKLANYLHKLHT